MRSASTLLAGLVLVAVSACSADEAKQDTADPSGTAGTTTDPSASDPSADQHPQFTETDYRYVLVRNCYCPFAVPVTVTVRDNEVTSAVARESGGRGISEGDPAPESHRLTINDIIDLAEDPSQNAAVAWPDGQAWPDRVRTDQVAGARDDDITYVIKQVRVR